MLVVIASPPLAAIDLQLSLRSCPIRNSTKTRICSCVFDAGTAREYTVERGRIAYVVPLDAAIRVNGCTVEANERVLVQRAYRLDITATAETEVLVLHMSG